MLIFKHRRTYFANLVEGELGLGTIGEGFFLFSKKTQDGEGILGTVGDTPISIS